MQRSGAILREVGTTNKTSLDDYRAAITERTRLILRVHPSNFHITGFTAKPELRELASLSHERELPLYEDLGSGCVVDLKEYGVREPLVSESLDAGADLVSFSTDKLLGGPQSGTIAGRADLVARVRRNPMFRALRLDKIILQVLSDTLRRLVFQHFDSVPALRMIAISVDELKTRAEALRLKLPGICCEVIAGESVIGGGSTPDQALPTWLLAIDGDAVEIEKRLRAANPPVIARIADDRLLVDLRTVSPGGEMDDLTRAVLAAAALR
jgi:L-seryl-tRNA(Ser) seleniumtransferase